WELNVVKCRSGTTRMSLTAPYPSGTICPSNRDPKSRAVDLPRFPCRFRCSRLQPHKEGVSMAEDLSTQMRSRAGRLAERITRRQHARRRFLLLTGAGLSASLLAACGQSAPPATKPADPAKPAES